MNIKIKRHYNVEFFNQFNLTLKYDTLASSFGFSMYFNPDDEQARDMLRPFHYHEIDVEHNGELLVRGTILNHNFGDSATKVLCSISGYSLPGVLDDCEIPVSLYPLQSDNLSLLEIARKLCTPFRINVKVDNSVSSLVNQVYKVTTASESDTIKSYLASLASQRDVILSHTTEGDLLFTRAKTRQRPIYHFNDDMPQTTIKLSCNGQGMHSHITMQKQADSDGGNSGESTVRNPFVPFGFRPTVKTQNSGNDVDTVGAAKNARKQELKNITLTINTNVWEIDNKIIKPNNLITVTSRENFIYEPTDFFIEEITFKGDEKETTALLKCVLPEVYNNNEPTYFF